MIDVNKDYEEQIKKLNNEIHTLETRNFSLVQENNYLRSKLEQEVDKNETKNK